MRIYDNTNFRDQKLLRISRYAKDKSTKGSVTHNGQDTP